MPTKSTDELRRMMQDAIAATTPEEDARIRAAAEADPDAPLIDTLPGKPRLGRPRKEVVKQQIALRLDPEVIERFKAGGPGWQSRMSDALRKAVGL